MAKPPPSDLQGFSVVLVGSFNPRIFQPAWLASNGLVRQAEADAAKVEIIHPEVSAVRYDGFRLQVTGDQYSITTQDERYTETSRDLTASIFQLLHHTPVHQMGINVELHFRMKSEDSWHAFGHLVSPKDIWEGTLKEPGLR